MPIVYKLRHIPLALGLLLFLVSLARWGAAALPYQDPTPALHAAQLAAMASARAWTLAGAALLLLGLAYLLVIRRLCAHRRPDR